MAKNRSVFLSFLWAVFLFVLVITVLFNLDLVYLFINTETGSKITTLRHAIAAYNPGYASDHIKPAGVKTSSMDGMKMLYIPKGVFWMGSNKNPILRFSPMHKVDLSAYWIDQVEVTNSMYEKCVSAGACEPPVVRLNPYYGKWAYRDYPVVYVNWYMAETYCKWAGRRLPTEAEWEKAARGADSRKYPWGNDDPTPRLANYADALIGSPLSAYRYPLGASPYGALNMAGNVREWVADWYDPNYYEYSPAQDPQGPAAGTEKVLRGSAYDADKNEITTYHRLRHEPDSAGLSRGFRCAQSE